jgi:DNA-binding phage protein
MYGYTLAIVQANKLASRSNLGVKLGRACIAANVPISQVAKDFNVTRTTVYNWFSGMTRPSMRVESAIEQYIKELA